MEYHANNDKSTKRGQRSLDKIDISAVLLSIEAVESVLVRSVCPSAMSTIGLLIADHKKPGLKQF